MKTALVTMSVLLMAPLALSAATSSEAAQIKQLQAEVANLQTQNTQLNNQNTQLNTQVTQQNTQITQLNTQVTQLTNQNTQLTAQLSALGQPTGSSKTPAIKPPAVPTTQGDVIGNLLNSLPANLLPHISDADAQYTDKITQIRTYLAGKLVGKHVRITNKLVTANISLTNKEHVFVEVEPLESKDFTWLFKGFYMPANLTQKISAMHVGDPLEVDAIIATCELKDLAGPGATRHIVELTLTFSSVDAHTPGQ